jgi:DNA repair protein RecO (recombination protein O)
VLRSIAYGEADRIVTLLTRRHGKLSAIARSARRSKRRFAGSLEGFALIDAELQVGSSELARLQSARVVRAFPGLLHDLPRLNAAGALLRLTRDLTPEHSPDEDLFEALVAMLAALERPDVPSAAFSVAFQLQLLALSGLAPLLHACGGCGKLPGTGRAAEFDPQRGCLVCRACGGAPLRLGAALRERMVAALQGDIVAVAQADWPVAELASAERLLSLFIAHRLQRAPEDRHSSSRPR